MTKNDKLNKGFKIKNGVLISYKGKEKEIVIPEGIIEIGNNAFSSCYEIKSISIPDSVKSIGSQAFYNCASLSTIILPKGIKKISQGMFIASAIKTVEIPESVEIIEAGAFAVCFELEKLILPESLKEIGEGAFDSSSLKELTIPKNVRKIGNNALNIPGLKVTFECDGFEQKGDFIFDSDNHLISYTGDRKNKRIVIPEGTVSLGKYIFDNNENLQEVIIPDSVVEIHEYAFRKNFKLKPEVLERIKAIQLKMNNNNLTLKNFELWKHDDQEVEYLGTKLINPKTKKIYMRNEIFSELTKILDISKIKSKNSEEDFQNFIKSFFEFQLNVTKLYLHSKE